MSWYAGRVAGSESNGRYLLAERLSRLVYPEY